MSGSVPNPITKPSAAAATSHEDDNYPHSSSASSSSLDKRSLDHSENLETDTFPKELLDWIVANQSTSFEKMQRKKSMQQSTFSEVDAMQYWLMRATAESMHGICIHEKKLSFSYSNLYIQFL